MEPVLTIAAAVLIIMAVWWKSNGKRSKVHRSLRSTPEVFIGDVENGEYVRLRGSVYAAGEKMRAPLSGRRCVYYHVKVKEDKGRNTYEIIEEEMMADVILTDGTDYVVVETDEPQTYLVVDRDYQQGFLNDADAEMIAFLKKHKETPENFFGFNRSLRYYEAILAPDEELTVAGYAEWRDASTFKFRIPADRVLVIRPGPQSDVYISDDPSLLKSPKV